MILENQNNLNFDQVDSEGKKPKDLSSYNSPIFKMLKMYENL